MRLWPDATRSQQCAAASCPPLPPMLSICVATRCANGPIRFISPRAPDSSSLFAHGIATLGSEPAPRLHASELYALAWDAGSGQLALLNYDRDGQATAWFDCRPAEETD